MLKVYELRINGEKEWIGANTIIEAIQTYLAMTDTSIIDFNSEDDIVELKKEEWIKLSIINIDYDENDLGDWKEKTFEQWLNENNTPSIIAGTPYY